MNAFFLKAAVAVLAIVGVSSANVEAQTYNLQPAAINMDAVQYNNIQASPTDPIYLLRLNNEYEFQVTETLTPEQPADPNALPPRCYDQMTPALRQQCQDQANRNCQNVWICVQDANCAWVAYIFRPSPRLCPQILWPAYSPRTNAFRL